MNKLQGKISLINGPVIVGQEMTGFKMREMVLVGDNKLIGEIISIDNDTAVIQVYEETEGLKRDEIIISTGKPLSLKLGPGMIGNMFDGIQRPLKNIRENFGNFIPEGIGLISIDEEKLWEVELIVKVGDYLREGQIFAKVEETDLITHKLLVDIKVNGKVIKVKDNGKYNINETLVEVEDELGEIHSLKMYQEWAVRIPRPIKKDFL